MEPMMGEDLLPVLFQPLPADRTPELPHSLCFQQPCGVSNPHPIPILSPDNLRRFRLYLIETRFQIVTGVGPCRQTQTPGSGYLRETKLLQQRLPSASTASTRIHLS